MDRPSRRKISTNVNIDLFPLLLALTAALANGQVCYSQVLGLSLQYCQPCGSPGLDDFCVKRSGACGNYATGGFNIYGIVGGGSGLAPHGYLTTGSTSGTTTTPPASCNTLINIANAIPNRALGFGTVPVYNQAGFFPRYGGYSIPRVSFNPFLLTWLRIIDKNSISQCLENNVPKHPYGPNNRWNTNWAAATQKRADSFHYEDNGNSTWSYQCYCDFCYSCQACGTVGK